MSEKKVKATLEKCFDAKHVDAFLKHFVDATEKFRIEEWDGVALKAGKFVEAVTKALMLYCKQTLPKPRDFKAGYQLLQLGKIPSADAPDEVRVVIPKACIFIYEVVNNRGGRHDAGEIDANSMDATVVLPLMSWVLAELVRFCTTGGDTVAATALIQELTGKVYPYFEVIDGRAYVNIDNLKATEYALLLLYQAYPRRIKRQDLVDSVKRHLKESSKKSTADTAVHKLKIFVDEENDQWKLRATGKQKAEELLNKPKMKK